MMEEKKINVEENLEKILTGLSDALVRDSLPKDFEKTVEELKKTYICKNAENASICLFFKIEMFTEQLAKMIHPDYSNVKKENLWKLEYLWQHYSNVENYISSFISTFEGLCCSTDKGRWLLDSYMRNLIDGSVPDMEKKKGDFHKPRFGTFDEWTAFIDAYINSRFSYSHELLTSTATLIKAAEASK